MRTFSLIAGFVACAGIFLVPQYSNAAADVPAPQLWMAPLDPQWRAVWNFPANDWDLLFESTGKWTVVSSRIQVFAVSKRFVLESNDVELRRVMAFLREHHIKLALQGTPLLATEFCGLGVEGHGPAHDMAQEAQRIHDAGGDLSLIAMDEPLFYGRFLRFFEWKGNRKICNYDIATLALQTAQKIAEVRKVFPNVTVGDIEPFGIQAEYVDLWNASLVQWIDAYRSTSGEPLAFIQADVVWRAPNWKRDLLAGKRITENAGIPLGIIYNASPDEADWTHAASDHFHLIEAEMHIEPAQAIFASWTDRPRKMLPETDPTSLTGLVFQYMQWRDEN